MKSSELRELFLKYFEDRGHTRVKSSSLVPSNDPTLFFTNAGMVQFKDVFTGQETRSYVRAASSQKCMRVSGKHNDLENVGHTPRHHTFFEMLGNFSFGDYFKEEAIAFGWEFLTKTVGLPEDRLYVTVFREDDEAEKLWTKFVPKKKIFRFDEEDNFWAMADTGPCGPCSEIHWDFGKGKIKKEDFESDRFMELWNLVFMEYDRDESGKLTPLAKPSIDTGLGLERLAAVVQGKKTSWDTDLFVPLIERIEDITGIKRGSSDQNDIALRVIADHIRGTVFLVADGVTPSNEGRGYVLRRIMRRAIRYGKMLGMDEPFFYKIAPMVIGEMGAAFPELVQHQKFVEKVVSAEEGRFFETLDRGLELLDEEFAKLKKKKDKMIPGDLAFRLYDTYGFPKDLTEIIAAEHGFSLDEGCFQKCMEEQRERGRSAWKGSGEEAVAEVWKELSMKGESSQFVGYNNDSVEAVVTTIVRDGAKVKDAGEGEWVQFTTNVTPFYGEAGGQVGDTGMAVGDGVELEITDTQRPMPDIIVHHAKVKKGKLKKGAKLTLAIDSERRRDVRRNHTATHLLHKALREVLGEHVKQAGSMVAPDRLRFDFSHFQALTKEELKEVEEHANAAVRQNFSVSPCELDYDEAISQGALAFFGEKYGDKVRMVGVGELSRELCGGTHVEATGEIGLIKVVSESSVAAGVRRIEAVTGRGAERYVEFLDKERVDLAKFLKVQPAELPARIHRLVDEVKKFEAQAKAARTEQAGTVVSDLISKAKEIGGVKVLASPVDGMNQGEMRELADRLKDKLGSGVVTLASNVEGKVALVVMVTKDLTKSIRAGDIMKELANVVGGKGGGRPDMAQGGGPDTSKLDEALAKVEEIVSSRMS
jgi:alanyl-tRNA synthetase